MRIALTAAQREQEPGGELCPRSRRFSWTRLRSCSVLSVCPDGVAGYERYNAMRADPALCFLEKVGMPDEKLLSAEQGVSDGAQDAAERWAGDGAELWQQPGSLLGQCGGVSCAQGDGREQAVLLSTEGRAEGSWSPV